MFKRAQTNECELTRPKKKVRRENLFEKLALDCLGIVISFMTPIESFHQIAMLNNHYMDLFEHDSHLLRDIMLSKYPMMCSIEIKESYGDYPNMSFIFLKSLTYGCYCCGSNTNPESYVWTNEQSIARQQYEHIESLKKKKDRNKVELLPNMARDSSTFFAHNQVEMSNRSVEYNGPECIKLCRQCNNTKKTLITKTTAKKLGMSEIEVQQLPHISCLNPTYSCAASMMLFVKINVERFLLKKGRVLAERRTTTKAKKNKN